MARTIPAAERVKRARALIVQAHELPVPTLSGWEYFSYVAQVKDLLRQARELIKLIPFSPSASEKLKKDVADVFKEIDEAEKEILNK